MEKVLREGLEGKKRVEAVEGAFDDFSKAGVKEGRVDAVLVAQAWHWCPDYSGALVR